MKRARARARAADLVLWLVDDDRSHLPKDPRARMGGTDESGFIAVPAKPGQIAVSAKTGAGIDALIARLSDAAAKLAGEPALVTHARQRQALEKTAEHLMALSKPEIENSEELFAEELRQAANALGRVNRKDRNRGRARRDLQKLLCW